MATFRKLTINGIRSFCGKNKEVIEFDGRITLIIGANGTGKTTILECIRYALTGSTPPNTRSGKSFVSDPILRGNIKTDGKIRLEFDLNNNKNKSIMIMR
jgi:DNA repair protein RAD50